MTKFKTIGLADIYKKNKLVATIAITRDQWGKFYIDNNGRSTQKRLNAEECVRYLLNVLNNR